MSTRLTRFRPVLLHTTKPRCSLLSARYSTTTPATIVDTSFWRSLIPKPLRKENRQLRKTKTREWNPATFFIVIFLLIGSMSIQMVALRNSFERYMRQSEVRIHTLREVVEKIQRGEPVDVEKALGTGEPKKESDWEELLKSIERDEAARKAAKLEKAKQSETINKTSPPKPPTEKETTAAAQEAEPNTTKTRTSSLGNFF